MKPDHQTYLINYLKIFPRYTGKIYPSRDEYEAHQERVLARISKHNNQQALSHSIEEGLKIQAMTRWRTVLFLLKHVHTLDLKYLLNLFSDCSVVRDIR